MNLKACANCAGFSYIRRPTREATALHFLEQVRDQHAHRYLLALFVAAGLVLAPFAAHMQLNEATRAEMVQSMAYDKPSCPHDTTPDDCQKCPLMSICAVRSFHAVVAFGLALSFVISA